MIKIISMGKGRRRKMKKKLLTLFIAIATIL